MALLRRIMTLLRRIASSLPFYFKSHNLSLVTAKLGMGRHVSRSVQPSVDDRRWSEQRLKQNSSRSTRYIAVRFCLGFV